jgi:hypothetical protein
MNLSMQLASTFSYGFVTLECDIRQPSVPLQSKCYVCIVPIPDFEYMPGFFKD